MIAADAVSIHLTTQLGKQLTVHGDTTPLPEQPLGLELLPEDGSLTWEWQRNGVVTDVRFGGVLSPINTGGWSMSDRLMRRRQ